MKRFVAPWLGLVMALLTGVVASAQEPPSDIDRARELARQSADFLDQKKYAEALDHATQAEALYHAPFHLSVIAQALEGLGRLAEAATKYEILIAEPLPPSAPQVFKDAQEEARQRLSRLLARVPSLLVIVRGGATNATATVDKKPLSLRSGTAVRFDPGPHEIAVTAPGFRPFSRTVTLPPRGGVVVVEAILTPEGAPTATPSGTSSASTGPVSTAAPTSGPSPIPAAIAFGVGGVGLAVGAISGGIFLDRLGGLRLRCPENRCSTDDEAELEGVRTLGDLATAGFAIAAAGVALGTVLFLVRPGGGSTQKGAAPTPKNTPSAKVTATGSFPAQNGVWIGPWVGTGSLGLAGRF